MPGKCPKCQKTCYDAEGTKVGDDWYHGPCFKCTQCKKGLMLTNYELKDATLYCKSCYGSLHGPGGFRGGGGSTTIGVVTNSVKYHHPPPQFDPLLF